MSQICDCKRRIYTGYTSNLNKLRKNLKWFSEYFINICFSDIIKDFLYEFKICAEFLQDAIKTNKITHSQYSNVIFLNEKCIFHK